MRVVMVHSKLFEMDTYVGFWMTMLDFDHGN